MNDNTTKLLEQLAQKLGTTAEYLWSVLVKQAFVSAITDLIYVVIILFAGYGLFRLHKLFSKVEENGDCIYEDYEDVTIKPMIIVTSIWAFLFILCFFSIGNIINGFINPEYWALNEVLDAFK
ncbi:hypothetical protein JZU46_04920 [bacterium]|jgi:hypothetical protein|nr:hypothetical protein [bacterium]